VYQDAVITTAACAATFELFRPDQLGQCSRLRDVRGAVWNLINELQQIAAVLLTPHLFHICGVALRLIYILTTTR
jgi:hypothetical protein